MTNDSSATTNDATLVKLINGEAVTNSQAIAAGTEVEHRAVLQLIRNNLADFEQFGGVAFEMRPFETAGGTQTREIALLTEPQATLLLTFMRNTEVVKRFKVALVKAFFDLRKSVGAGNVVSLPDRRALAQMVIEAEDRADRETAARLEAEAHALELEAPASAWTHMASSHGDYMVRDAAKVLSRDPSIDVGQQRLFKFMQAEGWIFRERGAWKPYQSQVDNGRLVQKLNRPYLNERTGLMEVPAPSIRVTTKGMAELHKRLGGGPGGMAALAVTA